MLNPSGKVTKTFYNSNHTGRLSNRIPTVNQGNRLVLLLRIETGDGA